VGIQIVAIGGSVRPDNFTWKTLSIVVDELKRNKEIGLDVFDPRNLDLAKPGLHPTAQAEELKKCVSDATGIILATPEYHGGVSSVMKQVIENLGFPSVLAGKPVALLGVAAGQIGAIKSLEQLRSICSHIGAMVLPGPVSVAGVQGLFEKDGKCNDEKVERRIRGVATTLIDYIKGHICPKIALEEMVRNQESP